LSSIATVQVYFVLCCCATNLQPSEILSSRKSDQNGPSCYLWNLLGIFVYNVFDTICNYSFEREWRSDSRKRRHAKGILISNNTRSLAMNIVYYCWHLKSRKWILLWFQIFCAVIASLDIFYLLMGFVSDFASSPVNSPTRFFSVGHRISSLLLHLSLFYTMWWKVDKFENIIRICREYWPTQLPAHKWTMVTQ